MSNAHRNTERRLQEIEQRLRDFEAPEAPPSLIESIQAEIPAELGSSGGGARPGRRGLYRLAASLAVVAVGGLLGYRLLQDGPQPGDAVPLVEPQTSPVELGEGLVEDGSGAAGPGTAGPREDPRRANTPVAQGSAGGADPADLDSSLVAQAEISIEIGEEVAAGTRTEFASPAGVAGKLRKLEPARQSEVPKPIAVDRISVGGNESGQQSVFRDDTAGNRGVEGTPSSSQVTSMKEQVPVSVPESEAKRARIDESVLTATAETPRADPAEITRGTRISDVELEAIPTARDPWAVKGREAGDALDGVALPQPDAGDQDLAPTGKHARTAASPVAGQATERRQEMGIDEFRISPSTGGTTEPNDQAYGDMFFQAYGTNPFIDTEDDAQSTFGIDVDTASYTMARSYLERGNLPPADAIRVEEFINYFDYDDPAPRSKDFAVVAEGAPSPFASTARTYLLRFALKGREIAESQRKSAVLTFVVDVSGSMNRENRLGLVKRALRLLVEQLDSGDAIGLVVYGSNGQVLLEPTSDHTRVLAAIESLRPGGSTNAEEGLVLGYSTARRHFREGAINRVILCSDGVANVGRTGPDSILARIGSEADEGIELTTVGFGMGNYNDVLMEQLADKGDGNYAYVDDLDAARRVFVENLSGTLETIAGDAKIQVEFDRNVVQSYRLLGYENRDIADRDFRNDAIDAGEIGAGHQVTALYEVKLRSASPRRGNPNVATLRLRYKSKRSGKVVEDAVNLRRSDLAGSWAKGSRGLQLAATAAEFAEVLRGSYWAKDSDLSGLAQRVRGLAHSGSWDSDLAEFTELIERAARLRGATTGGWEDGIER